MNYIALRLERVGDTIELAIQMCQNGKSNEFMADEVLSLLSLTIPETRDLINKLQELVL